MSLSPQNENMATNYLLYGTLTNVLPPLPDSPLSADLWLLNSCTVKGPSEDGLKNSIRKGRELGKPLVIAGCVPQGQRNHGDIKGLSVVGVGGMINYCVAVYFLLDSINL